MNYLSSMHIQFLFEKWPNKSHTHMYATSLSYQVREREHWEWQRLYFGVSGGRIPYNAASTIQFRFMSLCVSAIAVG